MNDLDRASEVEQRWRDEAIAAHHRANNHSGTSVTHCEDAGCGIEIPQARRDAIPGCRYCIECQERFEARAKRRGYAVHA